MAETYDLIVLGSGPGDVRAERAPSLRRFAGPGRTESVFARRSWRFWGSRTRFRGAPTRISDASTPAS